MSETDLLIDTKLQLHWAVQVIPATAMALLEPRKDDSHRNLGWDDDSGEFVGRESDRGLCVRFHVGSFSTILSDGSSEERTALAEMTLDDVRDWLSRSLPEYEKARPWPEYDLPHHPVSDGRAFEPDKDSLAELTSLYSIAHRNLAQVSRSESGSEVRCWPHHFDIATLIQLDDARSIGVGMTPGDGSYSQPYYYVSPWPYPEASNLRELDNGHWHTRGWTGAVLEYADFRNSSRVVGEFLESSIAAARHSLA